MHSRLQGGDNECTACKLVKVKSQMMNSDMTIFSFISVHYITENTRQKMVLVYMYEDSQGDVINDDL